MTIHLTYTYLWVALGIVWIVGVFIGNAMLAIGETEWWERIIVILWPVTVPPLLVFMLLRAIFWPEY